jgi:hypothetical protein
VRKALRFIAAALALGMAGSALAQVGADNEDIGHYIARVYGSGDDLSAAATAYARALMRLWDTMARNPRYDQNLTVVADEAQLCLQGKLDRVAPQRRDALINEMKRKLAGNPERFAGFLVAEQFAQQNPIQMTLSEREACGLVGVPGPPAPPADDQ